MAGSPYYYANRYGLPIEEDTKEEYTFNDGTKEEYAVYAIEILESLLGRITMPPYQRNKTEKGIYALKSMFPRHFKVQERNNNEKEISW